MRAGTCSAQATWAHRTGESGFSFWPTATASDANASGSAAYSTASGRHSGTTLTDAVVRMPDQLATPRAEHDSGRHRGIADTLHSQVKKDWPTPSASMPNDTESPESWLARAALLKEKHGNGNGAGMPLAVAVKIADWPTPRASENENRQTKASPSQLAGEHGWSLGAAVNHQWATPMASDYKSRGGSAGWDGSDLVSQVAATFVPLRNAALNSAWVCRLMGFPDGWTVIDGPPVAVKRSTPASPRARRRASP